MMFVKRAMAVAASLADRLVVCPRSTIVRVNDAMFFLWMPNWPAASATAAISVWDDGSSVERLRNCFSRPAISAAEPLTVLVTPAHAVSQSMAALMLSPRPAAATRPTLPAVVPTVVSPRRNSVPRLVAAVIESAAPLTEAEACAICALKDVMSAFRR